MSAPRPLFQLQWNWCLWLSATLPVAEVTLEWCWSLSGLLAGWEVSGTTLEGLLLSGWGRLDGISLHGQSMGVNKAGGEYLFWFPKISDYLVWGWRERNDAYQLFCSWRILLKIPAPPVHILWLVSKYSHKAQALFKLLLCRIVRNVISLRVVTQFPIALWLPRAEAIDLWSTQVKPHWL